MKIISWNVAGLRACLNKGFDKFFLDERADIYCLQETKLLEEQNPFHPYGYHEYLHTFSQHCPIDFCDENMCKATLSDAIFEDC